MGNCQTAEMVAVVVQHPGNGKEEKMYWEISASEVMGSNPGYYVALVVQSVPSHNPKINNTNNNDNNAQPSVKHQLKLLKPTDTLHFGQVYRLISFEDVIKEFSARKSVKLGKLLKESGLKSDAGRSNLDHSLVDQDGGGSGLMSRSSGSRRLGRHNSGSAQWKPALQSIAELGN